MYSHQSLILILLAIALTVIGPSLSVQGAIANPTNGQNGKDGNKEGCKTPFNVCLVRGGQGEVTINANQGNSFNGNGGNGGTAVCGGSEVICTARGGDGGSRNSVNFDTSHNDNGGDGGSSTGCLGACAANGGDGGSNNSFNSGNSNNGNGGMAAAFIA